ncbi:phosphoribosyltransferase [Phaeocystidibacter marisrubri]|nr:phosphoribosyltransferase [Phaeocystidibacter marisrubri]
MDEATIRRKIERIAWEVYERHIEEDVIYLVGITGTGYLLAEMLGASLRQINAPKTVLLELNMDKRNPLGEKSLLGEPKDLTNCSVVVVDDVLNSGSTLIYGVQHILEQEVKRCTTAVLIDRNHKRFPIKADVKGLSLSTSLQEHVEVDLTSTSPAAYLQ